MRILHVINSPKIGGTENWVLDFIAAADATIDNQVLLFSDEGPLFTEMAPHLHATVGLDGPRTTRTLRFAKLCHNADADQIWLHSDLSRAYGARLPRALFPWAVAVCHSPWGAKFVDSRLRTVGTRRGWDSVVLVSTTLHAGLARPEPPALESPLVVIPPWRTRLGATVARGAKQPRRLIFVARLVEGKGHRELLSAVADVRNQLPEVELILVGGGPLHEELERLAAELSISDCVTFVGESTEVLTLLNQADVFVHSSESEGFPRSAFEAALCGLPIVARDLSCFDSIVTDGVNGRLFGGPDGVALDAAILDVVSEFERYSTMASSNSQQMIRSIEERFRTSIEVIKAWTSKA